MLSLKVLLITIFIIAPLFLSFVTGSGDVSVVSIIILALLEWLLIVVKYFVVALQHTFRAGSIECSIKCAAFCDSPTSRPAVTNVYAVLNGYSYMI